MQKFWLCWCMGRGIPKKQHETLEDAKEEASRIAQKENDTIAILECIGAIRPVEMPVEFVSCS